MLNEELRCKSQGSSSHFKVLVIESRGGHQNRGSSNRGTLCVKSQGDSNRFVNIECYHCEEKRHIKRVFPDVKKGKQEEELQQQQKRR